MPKAPKPRHLYTVSLVSYASEEIKQRIGKGQMTIGKPEDLKADLYYLNTDERTAAKHFYKACKDGIKTGLGVWVMVYRDTMIIIRVRLEI